METMPDAHPVVVTPTDVVYQMRTMTLREPDGNGNEREVEGWVKVGSEPMVDVPDDGDCLFHAILRSMLAWSQDAATRSGPFSVAKQRLDAFAQQYNLPTVDLQFSVPADPGTASAEEKADVRRLRMLMGRHLRENFLRFYDASSEDREQMWKGYRIYTTWFPAHERFRNGEPMKVRIAKAEKISRRLGILERLRDEPTTSSFLKSALQRALEAARQDPPDHACVTLCLDMLRARYDADDGVHRRYETRDAAVIMTETMGEWAFDSAIHVAADLLGVFVDYYQTYGNDLEWTDAANAGGYGPTLTDEERDELMAQYAAHQVPPGRLPRFLVVKSPNHYRYQIPDDPYLESAATLKDVRLGANGDIEALADGDTVHMVEAALAAGDPYDEDDLDFVDPCRRDGAAPVPLWQSIPAPTTDPSGKVRPAYYYYWNYVTDEADKATMRKTYEDYVQERNANPMPGQIADWSRDASSAVQNAVLDEIARMIWNRKYGASKETQGSYTLAGGRIDGDGAGAGGAGAGTGGGAGAGAGMGGVGDDKRRDRFGHFAPGAMRPRPFRFADHVMQADEDPFTPEQLAYAQGRLRKAHQHFMMHKATRHGYGQIMLMTDTVDKPASDERTQAQMRHLVRKRNNAASDTVGKVDKAVHKAILEAVKIYKEKRDSTDKNTREWRDHDWVVEGYNVAVRVLAGYSQFLNGAPPDIGAWMFLLGFYRSTTNPPGGPVPDPQWMSLIMATSDVLNTKHAQYKTKRNFERFTLFMNELVRSNRFGARIEEVAEAFKDQFPTWAELKRDRP